MTVHRIRSRGIEFQADSAAGAASNVNVEASQLARRQAARQAVVRQIVDRTLEQIDLTGPDVLSVGVPAVGESDLGARRLHPDPGVAERRRVGLRPENPRGQRTLCGLHRQRSPPAPRPAPCAPSLGRPAWHVHEPTLFPDADPPRDEQQPAAPHDDAGELIRWFAEHYDRLPLKPFTLRSGVYVSDPDRFYKSLAADIRAGPTHRLRGRSEPRQRWQPLLEDLADLRTIVESQ